MKKTVFVVVLVLMLTLALGGAMVSAGISEPIFEGPVLITSVGQSADGQLVKVLADRVGISYAYDSLAPASVVANYKTVILVVGGSSKGLGAAGINQEQEESRARALIAAAKDSGTKVLFMHVGGEARRGDLTDRFVTIAAPSSQYMIIVADGNKDSFISGAGSGVAFDLADTLGDAGRFLKAAFK